MLKRMQRRVNRAETEALLAQAPRADPEPRDADDVHHRLPRRDGRGVRRAGRVRRAQQKFERLGVFTYSFEPDTPAAKLPDHLPEEVKNERRDRLMAVQQEIAFAWNEAQLGRQVDVILDSAVPGEKNAWIGRSYADAPDVDGVVYVTGEKLDASARSCRAKSSGSANTIWSPPPSETRGRIPLVSSVSTPIEDCPLRRCHELDCQSGRRLLQHWTGELWNQADTAPAGRFARPLECAEPAHDRPARAVDRLLRVPGDRLVSHRAGAVRDRRRHRLGRRLLGPQVRPDHAARPRDGSVRRQDHHLRHVHLPRRRAARRRQLGSPPRASRRGWPWSWSPARCSSPRSASFFEEGGTDFSAKWAGKWKMLFQCLAVGFSLYRLGNYFDPNYPGRRLDHAAARLAHLFAPRAGLDRDRVHDLFRLGVCASGAADAEKVTRDAWSRNLRSAARARSSCVLAIASFGTSGSRCFDRLKRRPDPAYEPRRPVPWSGVWTLLPIVLGRAGDRRGDRRRRVRRRDEPAAPPTSSNESPSDRCSKLRFVVAFPGGGRRRVGSDAAPILGLPKIARRIGARRPHRRHRLARRARAGLRHADRCSCASSASRKVIR